MPFTAPGRAATTSLTPFRAECTNTTAAIDDVARRKQTPLPKGPLPGTNDAIHPARSMSRSEARCRGHYPVPPDRDLTALRFLGNQGTGPP
ncbi:hypothetical protein B0T18DRAFT_404373 [Schizothecium vesticola]|uniref:Uncharacterized protein n=1 Tax=Schizothecium vesticola TaxID=314040 RepID=A0AA40F761_9PEZI|nr:hypothetical protein B0T18DRAFT_404373 [Schizothecium vesticola]